jgi:hypothetical protein
MPSTAEQMASQLIEFVHAIEKKANAARLDQPKRYMAADPPKDRALMTYEMCVKHLTGEDRARLRRILKRMTEALALPV